jgi:hypothetical protein
VELTIYELNHFQPIFMVLIACPLEYTVERNRREKAMPVLPTEKTFQKKTAVFCKSTTVLLEKMGLGVDGCGCGCGESVDG